MPAIRGYILDLETNDGFMFLLNPQQFEESYTANWTDKPPLSGSFHRMQFKSTANPRISIEVMRDRELIAHYARRLGTYDETQIKRAMDYGKSFLQSCLYPRRHQGSILMQSPPALLCVWPNVLSMRAVLQSCTITNEEFDVNGYLVKFTARLELTEQRLEPIYSADIRRLGSMRGSRSGRSTID
jgi:hypothetical protein